MLWVAEEEEVGTHFTRTLTNTLGEVQSFRYVCRVDTPTNLCMTSRAHQTSLAAPHPCTDLSGPDHHMKLAPWGRTARGKRSALSRLGSTVVLPMSEEACKEPEADLHLHLFSWFSTSRSLPVLSPSSILSLCPPSASAEYRSSAEATGASGGLECGRRAIEVRVEVLGGGGAQTARGGSLGVLCGRTADVSSPLRLYVSLHVALGDLGTGPKRGQR